MLVKKVPEFSPPSELLEGKNILITGAGSGIGRQLAIDFAQKGANLILMSKDFKKLMSVQDQIKGKNNKEPLIIEFDFLKAKDKEYKRLSEGINEHISCLDGLVHVAAVLGYISPFMSTSLGQLKTVMEVNFESNFLLTQLLMPQLLKARSPSVIFTSSGVGRRPRALWTSYGISKGAVEAFMQTLADEYENNIRFCTYNPGATKTAMRAQAFPAEDPNTVKDPNKLTNDFLWLLSEENNTTGIAFDYSKLETK